MEPVRFVRGDLGPASGGTYITCHWHQGCAAMFCGSSFTTTRGARKEAKAAGWLVAMEGGRFISPGRFRRIDYCPKHAPRERERRGLTARSN